MATRVRVEVERMEGTRVNTTRVDMATSITKEMVDIMTEIKMEKEWKGQGEIRDKEVG